MATVEERFLEKIDMSQDGCWIWKAGFFKSGYGCFSYEGKPKRAHRIAYQFAKGEIPDGMYVLHHCDNPACVKPSHLYIGDQTQNMIDMKMRGRVAKGESAAKSKLKEHEVIQIKEMLQEGVYTQKEIADIFGVAQVNISHINNEKTWKHVEVA